MYSLLLAFHILICFGLIAVVLLQSGKGGGLAGGAFGGTAQTVFGGRGATDFITRATMVLGGLFFVTSLVLALMSVGATNRSRSLLQEEARRSSTAAPAQAPLQSPQGPTSPTQPPASGQTPATGAPAKPQPGSGR